MIMSCEFNIQLDFNLINYIQIDPFILTPLAFIVRNVHLANLRGVPNMRSAILLADLILQSLQP